MRFNQVAKCSLQLEIPCHLSSVHPSLTYLQSLMSAAVSAGPLPLLQPFPQRGMHYLFAGPELITVTTRSIHSCHPQALPTMYQPQVISNLALGLANLRYSPGTPLLLELQSASMRVMVPKVNRRALTACVSTHLSLMTWHRRQTRLQVPHSTDCCTPVDMHGRLPEFQAAAFACYDAIRKRVMNDVRI